MTTGGGCSSRYSLSVWGLRLAGTSRCAAGARVKTRATREMLARARATRGVYALRSIYLTQAVVMWFVSLPVQVAMFERSEPGVLAWVGTAVWPSVSSSRPSVTRSCKRFRADPSSQGKVMDRGLWRYTRHPNYFGDAMRVVGHLADRREQWAGALTILSPLLMTWTLTRKTGKPLLEQGMADADPATPTTSPVPAGSSRSTETHRVTSARLRA